MVGSGRVLRRAARARRRGLDAVLAANAAAGLPPHDVSPLQGRFLEILVRLLRARRVLEIGTLGGYSTICMARGLPDDGRIVTLEAEPRHAAVARRQFRTRRRGRPRRAA
jgi:predicted O-methyltransferase YrrM